jgi:ketosteroid isomerase-like protein
MSGSNEASVAASVRNVIGRHTQAQDAGRTEDVVALYTKDAVLDVPGIGHYQGQDAIRTAFEGWTPSTPQLHIVTNTEITSWSEQEVTAASDAAFVQRSDTGWAVQVVGHYQDTFRLVDGAWLLQSRITTY